MIFRPIERLCAGLMKNRIGVGAALAVSLTVMTGIIALDVAELKKTLALWNVPKVVFRPHKPPIP